MSIFKLERNEADDNTAAGENAFGLGIAKDRWVGK
jgi:hypothetical protein